MERKQPRGRTIRLLIVGALLIALTASYLTILHDFHVSEQPGERMFGASDSGAAAEVYLEPLSIDAANEGMQGVVGFDVLVDQDGNFFVSECNARYTGASYPAITAMRLGGQEWMSWTPQTTLYNPADIQFNGAGYDASRQGAVVMNRARLASHRVVETLLIGPPDTYSEMMRAVHGQLNPNRNNVRAFRPRQPLQAEDVSAHKRAKVA